VSSDLKVGDVCEIVNTGPMFDGTECVIVQPETPDVVGMNLVTGQIARITAFGIRLAGERFTLYAMRRQLRKKPPKSDVDGILRTDFTPAPETFEQLVERLTRTTEDA